MSGLGKGLLAFALLLVTNLGTFGYATWRCRQEAEGAQRLLAEAQQKQQEAEAKNAAAEQRLERLRVWGELLELQRDLTGVHATINQLNFGNAIQAIDRIETRLRQGEYGQLFRQHSAELVPLLERAELMLRKPDPMARTYLVELDQRAFSILAASAGPGELPGFSGAAPTPTPTPLPSPQPSPMMEATPAQTLPATPTPKPGATSRSAAPPA
jgi:hypothetical protein